MRGICFFLLMFNVPVMLFAQITKPGYEPPVKKSATAYKGPKKFTGKSKIIVEINVDGTLSVDYEKIWDFKKGEVWKSAIAAGEHKIELSNGVDTWRETVETKSGAQLIVETKLGLKVDTDRQKETQLEEQKRADVRETEVKSRSELGNEKANQIEKRKLKENETRRAEIMKGKNLIPKLISIGDLELGTHRLGAQKTLEVQTTLETIVEYYNEKVNKFYRAEKSYTPTIRNQKIKELADWERKVYILQQKLQYDMNENNN